MEAIIKRSSSLQQAFSFKEESRNTKLPCFPAWKTEQFIHGRFRDNEDNSAQHLASRNPLRRVEIGIQPGKAL